MDIQITLVDKTGTYKPHSTIIREVDTQGQDFTVYYTVHKRELQKRAIENICHQLRCNWVDLQRQGFTQVKAREYDLEKIEQQKRANLIKKMYERRKENKENENR